jgi:phenylpropionate dioxygenase-like ring-hydroxylating dioxygenase large terminal subunit
VFTNDRYTSPEFLEHEKQLVFRRTWIALARESDVSRAGDCLSVDELDESLLLVRGEDNVVRTFRNTCRHRGTRLISGRCRARQITCRYHGWTYGLDGRLVSVPKPEGFEGLVTQAYGLSQIRTETWGGFVWCSFAPDSPPVRQSLGPLLDRLDPYRLSEMRPLLRRTWTLPCNWKVVLDQATESYHLRSVHPGLHRVVDGALTFEGHGPHFVQTIPVPKHVMRDWLDRHSVPVDLAITTQQMRVFQKYMIFPNTLLNVMPYHLTVFRVFPLTADTCRFHYEFHVPKHPGPIGRLRGWLTLLGSLWILREDLRVLSPFQAGVKTAPDGAILFHREEQALEYFHSVLDRHLQQG